MDRRRITALLALATAVAALVAFYALPASATHCSACIDADDIQTNAVGSSEIATDAVGGSEVRAGAIDGDEIVNGSVTTADLAGSAEVSADHVSLADFNALTEAGSTIVSMTLPAATWWIVATLEIDNDTEGTDVFVTCDLKVGSTVVDSRNAHVAIGDGGVGDAQSASMQTMTTLGSATSVSIFCSLAGTPDNLDIDQAKITALRITNPL